MNFPPSQETQADFVRRLPAAVLGAAALGETAYILGAGHPLIEIAAIGGGVLGAALHDGAQYLANRMNPPQ